MDTTSFYRFGAPAPGQVLPDWEEIKRDQRQMPEFYPWRYGLIYQREDGAMERLVIGADEHQVDLLMALAKAMPEPL